MRDSLLIRFTQAHRPFFTQDFGNWCHDPSDNGKRERSLSTLRRVKPNTKRSTGQDRLDDLALMSIHRDIILVIPAEVSNELARNRSRQLDVI